MDRTKLMNDVLAVLKGTEQEMKNYKIVLQQMPDQELEQKAALARRKKIEIENADVLGPIHQAVRQEEAQRMAQVNVEKAFNLIFSTPIKGYVPTDNLASRKEIEGWLHPGEVLSPNLGGDVRRWFIQVLKENPKFLNFFAWVPIDSPEQLKRDREMFSKAARHSGSIADNEANFKLARDTFGPGFGKADLTISELAIKLAGLDLGSASHQEKQQWADESNERRVEREDAILASDDPGLRQQQKEIRQQRFAEQTKNAQQQEQQRRFDAVTSLSDGGFQYPPLPRMWNGQTLDADFLKGSDRETFKTLMKRFGSVQINRRLARMD